MRKETNTKKNIQIKITVKEEKRKSRTSDLNLAVKVTNKQKTLVSRKISLLAVNSMAVIMSSERAGTPALHTLYG